MGGGNSSTRLNKTWTSFSGVRAFVCACVFKFPCMQLCGCVSSLFSLLMAFNFEQSSHFNSLHLTETSSAKCTHTLETCDAHIHIYIALCMSMFISNKECWVVVHGVVFVMHLLVVCSWWRIFFWCFFARYSDRIVLFFFFFWLLKRGIGSYAGRKSKSHRRISHFKCDFHVIIRIFF